jgi:hypothetical protein
MTSSTNSDQISRRNKRAAEDRETDAEVTRALMSTVKGRRWLWLLMERAQCFAVNMNLDPAYMAWEKGTKNEAMRILQSILRYSPDDYIRMTNENTSTQLQDPSNGRPDSE